MAKSTAVVKKTAKRVLSAKQKAVQEVLQITWVLKGDLKRAQMLYLHIGGTLADIRDRKLYERLGHVDLECYADEHLSLGRASLYRYLKVYDWVKAKHKEWLLPHPKGVIPDLSDTNGLIWIEEKLASKDLDPKTRSGLEGLQAKALTGQLREKELNQWRGVDKAGTRREKTLKSFLSSMRTLRKRGAELVTMPPEAVAHLDAAINIIKNSLADESAK